MIVLFTCTLDLSLYFIIIYDSNKYLFRRYRIILFYDGHRILEEKDIYEQMINILRIK